MALFGPPQMNKTYKVFWGGPAFGDNLLAAWVVNVLNFNHIPAVLCAPPRIKKLINSKMWNPRDHSSNFTVARLNRAKRKDPNFTILTDLLNSFIKKSKENITLAEIDIENAPHPVIYRDDPSIKGCDVCLVTQSGPWTPYRNWPHFNELKSLLIEDGVTFIDLSQEGIKENNFLNYVKKSKIYLGIETGASHYAAPHLGGKGLIIQSGYCDFDYWAAHYNYQPIEHPVECAPCWKRQGCEYDHKCMRKISAQKVYEKIMTAMHD